jgi:hypothetical protein
MAISTYNYSIADDTPNGKVAPRNLDKEIVDNLNITKQLAGVTVAGNDLNIDFQEALTTAEETELDTVVGAHAGEVTIKAPQRLTASGVPLYMPEWREGNPTDFISFNWCDKTTWFSASTRVNNEVLTDSGDGLTWNSVNAFWICVSQGRIPQEHRLAANYGVAITVDDVAVTEHTIDAIKAWEVSADPADLDGDYMIDYDTGDVIFKVSQAGKSVKATYSYATTADFYVEPLEGTTIRLTAVEVQFSNDITLTDSVRFDIEGFVEAFAPHLVDDVSPNYVSSFPTGFRIPLGSPRIYQTMHDYIAEAQRAFPLIPALGGSGWRGMQHPVYVMRWPYQEDATRDLHSAMGMRIKISLINNTPFSGTMATATLYAVSTNGS